MFSSPQNNINLDMNPLVISVYVFDSGGNYCHYGLISLNYDTQICVFRLTMVRLDSSGWTFGFTSARPFVRPYGRSFLKIRALEFSDFLYGKMTKISKKVTFSLFH